MKLAATAHEINQGFTPSFAAYCRYFAASQGVAHRKLDREMARRDYDELHGEVSALADLRTAVAAADARAAAAAFARVAAARPDLLAPSENLDVYEYSAEGVYLDGAGDEYARHLCGLTPGGEALVSDGSDVEYLALDGIPEPKRRALGCALRKAVLYTPRQLGNQ